MQGRQPGVRTAPRRPHHRRRCPAHPQTPAHQMVASTACHKAAQQRAPAACISTHTRALTDLRAPQQRVAGEQHAAAQPTQRLLGAGAAGGAGKPGHSERLRGRQGGRQQAAAARRASVECLSGQGQAAATPAFSLPFHAPAGRAPRRASRPRASGWRPCDWSAARRCRRQRQRRRQAAARPQSWRQQRQAPRAARPQQRRQQAPRAAPGLSAPLAPWAAQ